MKIQEMITALLELQKKDPEAILCMTEDGCYSQGLYQGMQHGLRHGLRQGLRKKNDYANYAQVGKSSGRVGISRCPSTA